MGSFRPIVFRTSPPLLPQGHDADKRCNEEGVLVDVGADDREAVPAVECAVPSHIQMQEAARNAVAEEDVLTTGEDDGTAVPDFLADEALHLGLGHLAPHDLSHIGRVAEVVDQGGTEVVGEGDCASLAEMGLDGGADASHQRVEREGVRVVEFISVLDGGPVDGDAVHVHPDFALVPVGVRDVATHGVGPLVELHHLAQSYCATAGDHMPVLALEHAVERGLRPVDFGHQGLHVLYAVKGNGLFPDAVLCHSVDQSVVVIEELVHGVDAADLCQSAAGGVGQHSFCHQFCPRLAHHEEERPPLPV